MRKEILLIITKPPFSNITQIEQLDLALAMACLEYDVTLLFMEAGVLHLTWQQPHFIKQKPFTKLYSATLDYDINELLVCAESLEQYHVKPQENIKLQVVSAHQIKAISANRQVICL